jgi:hypothetical protein
MDSANFGAALADIHINSVISALTSSQYGRSFNHSLFVWLNSVKSPDSSLSFSVNSGPRADVLKNSNSLVRILHFYVANHTCPEST